MKLALTLTLFMCNDVAEALKTMYIFGHPRVLIPSEYRENLYIEKPKYHDDACYRVIFYIYDNYAITSLNDNFTKEKMRVVRLIEAREYICTNEPHLCAYFFKQKQKI